MFIKSDSNYFCNAKKNDKFHLKNAKDEKIFILTFSIFTDLPKLLIKNYLNIIKFQ